jgi:hypothetical protein
MRCCYCKRAIVGKVQFRIPHGYAQNSAHNNKPLCVVCGSKPTPTLDDICERLDKELLDGFGRARKTKGCDDEREPMDVPER